MIEQEMVSNPILEEVMPGDEVQEISENILDQNASGFENGLENGSGEIVDAGLTPSSAETDFLDALPPEGVSLNGSQENVSATSEGDEDIHNESSDAFDEIDFGREFQDYLDPGYRTQEIEYKEDAPSFEQFLSHTESLSEHLEWQLHLLDIPEDVAKAAILVIGNLDDDGRLEVSVEEIAQMAGCSVECAEQARQAVMQLEPIGCGAFDVKECLLAQLRAKGEARSLAADLVTNHLEDLQPHRLQHLSKDTGVEVHALDAEIQKIRVLDPYP
ncbi:MAG TPA: hypothetical protein VJQ25_00460, partial [Nitrospira sp.]|nr:hypothetical protein [Nitrospira sp.]